jgi:hypothetical protein
MTEFTDLLIVGGDWVAGVGVGTSDGAPRRARHTGKRFTSHYLESSHD